MSCELDIISLKHWIKIYNVSITRIDRPPKHLADFPIDAPLRLLPHLSGTRHGSIRLVLNPSVLPRFHNPARAYVPVMAGLLPTLPATQKVRMVA